MTKTNTNKRNYKMNKTKKLVRDPRRHIVSMLPAKQTWEAFTYLWTNKTLNRIYVGYHVGQEDDNYICSSKSKTLRKDWDNPNNQWERTILFRGSAADASSFEYDILSELNVDDQSVYNMACYKNNSYSQEVRDKMGERQARTYWLHSMYSEEPIEKITNLHQWCKNNYITYSAIHQTLHDIKAPYVHGMYLTRADGDAARDNGRRPEKGPKTRQRLMLKEPVQAADEPRQNRYEHYVQALGCQWSGETDPVELILVDKDTKKDITKNIINSVDTEFYSKAENCFILSRKAYNHLLTLREEARQQ